MPKAIKVTGNFKRTFKFLENIARPFHMKVLQAYGEKGVKLLSAATPRDTGKTAASWSYRIEEDANGATIYWENSNVVNYVNVAVILQYGHGTRNGGYVQGIDYINPALKPVFEGLVHDLWEEVESS